MPPKKTTDKKEDDATAGRRVIEDAVQAYLDRILPGMFKNLARAICVSELSVGSGTFGKLGAAKVELGEVAIGRLLLQNATAGLESERAYLRNFQVGVEVKLKLDWWIDVWIYDDSGTEDLGSLTPPNVGLGDVSIPGLDRIDLTAPAMATENLTMGLPTLTNLDLGAGELQGARLVTTTLPADGFQIGGMSLGSFGLASAQLPAVTVKEATLETLGPQAALHLPRISIPGFSIPQAGANDVRSGAIAVAGELSQLGVSVNFGVFGVTVWAQPLVHLSVDEMLLQGVKLSVGVGLVQVEDLHIPAKLQGVTMKKIHLSDVQVTDVRG